MDRRGVWDVDDADDKDAIWRDVTIKQGNLSFPVRTAKDFEQLGLPKALLQGIYAAGLQYPRDIQKFVFPMLFDEPLANIVIHAPTKTGKTTAAIIKALYVSTNTRDPHAKVLLVHPTRDSAWSALDTAKILAKFCSQVSFHLAVRDNDTKHTKRLGKVTDKFFVGTPEKLREYVDKKYIDAEDIKLVIFDDIDSKTSGSGHQIIASRLLKDIPRDAQRVLLTCASRTENTNKFAANVMLYPIFIEFPLEVRPSCVGVKHHFVVSSSFDNRMKTLSDLLRIRCSRQMVVVCNLYETVVDVYQVLKNNDVSHLACLHKKVKQDDKRLIVEDFKRGAKKVLITTPVYVDSIEFHTPSKDATIVNFDIQVTRDNLDHDVYHKRATILSGIPGGLSINMVDERWAGYTTDERGQKLELQKPSDLKKHLRKLQISSKEVQRSG